MRKRNGTTIVELLISVILIALVLALLFNLLVQVRNEDVTNNTQSNYVINQAAIIKEIEQDFIDYGVKKVSSCSLSSFCLVVDHAREIPGSEAVIYIYHRNAARA